jgi:FdrA protein
MQVSAEISAVPGVSGALVAMATGLNLQLLAGMGFDRPADASSDDLVVAVAAADDGAVGAALARLESALGDPPAAAGAGFGAAPPPRTVGAAVRRARATLALVSTPGRYAFLEASDALDAGASVLVFSDNVPVAQEVALKERAAALGLLVMGPDCGTAVIGGVGLGFANVVRPGPVGLVAASGTGAQQVMALLDAAGVGVSHCLGVGGRDLSAEVGGRSTLAALAALDADPATEVVVLVSKPPAPDVAERVRSRAAGLGTPVVTALLGPGQPDLSDAVRAVLAALGRPAPASWPRWLPPDGAPDGEPADSGGAPDGASADSGGALRGLFSGGTLCDEAMVIASAELGRVESNIPLRPEWRLPDDLRADAHAMIDFGDDLLTAGRPHPMIDPTLRLGRLAREAADPRCRVILLDVVLGHGAHPDPAADLAPAVAAGRGREIPLDVVVSLTGTDGDPQGLARQAEALCAAGAGVYRSNAEAARAAVAIARGRT